MLHQLLLLDVTWNARLYSIVCVCRNKNEPDIKNHLFPGSARSGVKSALHAVTMLDNTR